MLRSMILAILGLFMSVQLSSPVLAQTVNDDADSMEESGLENIVVTKPPFRIVGFGDSLTAGYLLENDQSFTAVLENKLRDKGYDVTVDNAGVSGDTTTGGLARIDWSIPDDTGLVILELGANDMLRGLSAELSEKNLDSMLTRLKERKIPVIFVGMLSAPNMGGDAAKPIEAIYPRLAKKYDVPFYPFFLDGVSGNRQYLLDDGMHPNAEGVNVIADKILPLVEKTLDSLGQHPDNGNSDDEKKGNIGNESDGPSNIQQEDEPLEEDD